MSMKYLGETFDIHGGGLENQFPHHECEIAQSEAATGAPFVKYWLHNNMVTVDGRKMGKSLGNFTTLKDAFAKWSPEVVRFFVLQSHYRSTLDFSAAAVEGAGKGLERLTNARRNLRDRIRAAPAEGQGAPLEPARYKAAFLAAMDDDFNTPQAIAVLFDLARDVNQLLTSAAAYSAASLQSIEDLFEELEGTVLGIAPAQEHGNKAEGREPELIKLIVDLRKEIRAQRLWALSDRIRDGLARLGIVLEDRKEGTTWKA
jgi:cysteinyl-tRNA synthetase